MIDSPINKLHLAFVYHLAFWEKDGRIWTSSSPIGRYVDSLALYFEKITIVTPKRQIEEQALYCLQSSNFHLLEVKSQSNIQSFWFHIIYFYLTFFRTMPEWDIVNIRLPTLMGFPAFLAARYYRKPVFLIIVGENLAIARMLGYSWLKQLIVNAEAYIQEFLTKQMVRYCLTFTNGEDLYKKTSTYSQNVYIMRSSTIKECDIASRDHDTCQQFPFKILTVAMIIPHKGTALIPEIIRILKEKGIDIIWFYIGEIGGNAGKQELQKALSLARKFGVSSQLKFLGVMNWEELRAYYRSSDIFVLPTQLEGIPRVILEAQASGLPVVSTLVGGIPQAVQDGIDALLVLPTDTVGMADAIIRVIGDPILRHSLIQNGLKSAQQFTLEAETHRMMEKVNEIL